jgi:SPP1 gp7 family putative phage head morphogenesis protein
MDDSSKGFATVNNKAVEINIDWSKEASMLTSEIEAYERLAMEKGVATGIATTGIRMDDNIKYLISNATTQRLKYVVDEVTETNRKQVNDTITKLIDDGSSVDELKGGIKQYFNRANNRAETIARTEITAQLNGGLLLQYDQAGIKQKQWVTNIDEYTRDAHVMANGQIVDTNKAFLVDGEFLMMPGDGNGSAGNVINCRCSVFPVMEE